MVDCLLMKKWSFYNKLDEVLLCDSRCAGSVREELLSQRTTARTLLKVNWFLHICIWQMLLVRSPCMMKADVALGVLPKDDVVGKSKPSLQRKSVLHYTTIISCIISSLINTYIYALFVLSSKMRPEWSDLNTSGQHWKHVNEHQDTLWFNHSNLLPRWPGMRDDRISFVV